MNYEITAPDGRKFQITAPEGASERDVYEFAQKHWERRQSIEANTKREMTKLADPTGSFSENFNAGMGKALTDLWRGGQQLVGMGPSAEEVKEQRRLDAPLLRTGGGMGGYVAGNFIPMAASTLAPGSSSVVGAGVIGSTMAALQPTETPQERLVNQGVGFALGSGSQYLGGQVATKLGERQAVNQVAKQRNTLTDATLADAQKAGYVVPPSAHNPTFLTNRLESLAGKAALNQEASARNQQVTNELARRYLGLPSNTAISEQTLETLRNQASKPYREIAGISPTASKALEDLKQARFDTNAFFKHYNVSADPNSLAKARQASAQVTALEQQLEEFAQQAGRPQLIPQLRAARQQIAKTYEVEKALNVATGDVSAHTLGRSLDRGKPISGDLNVSARFAQAFPQYSRDAAGNPQAGVSHLEPVTASLLGIGGATATDSPYGFAAAALPLLRGPARFGLLSKPGQTLATPSYGGLLGQVDPEVAGLLVRAGGPAVGLGLLSQ